MPVGERTLSYVLRNSGEVLEEVEHHDILIHRRDGQDLFLALHSRERALRESLGILAQFARAALRDVRARESLAKSLVDELPWTRFLPAADRQEFIEEFAQLCAACVELGNYDPLLESLTAWKATAETHATPRIASRLSEPHPGPSVPARRPAPRRGRAR